MLTPKWIRTYAAAIRTLIALTCVLLSTSLPAQVVEKVHEWQFTGARPSDHLVEGPDGHLYGVMATSGLGVATIVRCTKDGEVTLLHQLNETGIIASGLTKANGRFYGIGGDAFFSYDLASGFTRISGTSTTNGVYATLTLSSDGNFYGISGTGKIFRLTPQGDATVLYTMSSSDGTKVRSELLEASDGYFYGAASDGGAQGRGTVFRVSKDGDFKVLRHLAQATDGDGAKTPTEVSPGVFYTVCSSDSVLSRILRVTSTGETSLVHLIHPADGWAVGRLVKGNDGNFYGMLGTTGKIRLYRVTPAGEYNVVGTVETGAQNDVPNFGGLLLASDGNFYGNTLNHLFKVTHAGEFTVLAELGELEGMAPTAPPLHFNGVSYGLTSGGGGGGNSPQNGVFYSVGADLKFERRLIFPGASGPSHPVGVLTRDAEGRLHGVSRHSGEGESFRLELSEDELTPPTLIPTNNFQQASGGVPMAGLVSAEDGAFYGTASTGGEFGHGTVYKLTTSGTRSVLHSFNATDGKAPATELITAGGFVFGTTTAGGANNAGTVFKIALSSGQVEILHEFAGTDGSVPLGALEFGADGVLYGTTSRGGAADKGLVFSVTQAGTFQVLHEFDGANGAYPNGGLTFARDGNVYGTAQRGGAHNAGVLFRLTKDGGYSVLYSFNYADGAWPRGKMTIDDSGTLWGCTERGGSGALPHVQRDLLGSIPGGGGTVFRVHLPPSIESIGTSTITTASAGISAEVFSNQSHTHVTVEYGITAGLGLQTTAVGVDTEGAATATFQISGLQPHTTYYYRLVAGNEFGTVTSDTRSFTTANSTPAAGEDSILSYGQPVTADVGTNDTDADGDSLEISQVTQPAFGTVTWDGLTITYTPGPGYLGRDSFTYTISDGFGGSATAEVHVYSDRTLSRSLLQSGVTFTGLTGSLKSFDGFAFSGEEGNAFIGLAKAGSGKRLDQVIIGAEPSEVLLSTGAEVSGLPGVFIGKFRSLVGKAVLADFNGGKGVSAKNDRAILVIEDEGPRLVAREGDGAIGISDAKFAAFTSLDWAGGAVFTAKVKGGGITAQNDNGIWAETDSGLRLVCRERDDILVAGEEKRVKSIAALLASTNTSTLASGCAPNGLVVFRVTFTDKTQAILRFDRNNPDAGLTVVGASGDPVSTLADATYVDFGLPVCAADGSVAFRATANMTTGSTAGKVQGLVIDGAFHTTPAGASTMTVPVSDPVVGPAGQAAVMAKVLGGKPRKVAAVASVTENGLEPLALVGNPAPGVDGAKFQRFAQLGILPERGVIFAGLLAQKKGVVNAKNRNGIWAQDSEGELILVLQAGSSLSVEGTEQQVQSFQLLPSGSGAQALGEDGTFVCLVKFKGGTQRVMQFRVP